MSGISKKKIVTLLIVGGLLLVSYITVKYVLPVVWPFIFAYFLAVLIHPVIRFLRDKLHFHKNAATLLTIAGALSLLIGIIALLTDRLISQLIELAGNFPVYERNINSYIERTCNMVERTVGLQKGFLYVNVYDGISGIVSAWKEDILPVIMSGSIQTVVLLVDIIIVTVLVVMSVFYMARDLDKIRNTGKENIFYKEISFSKGLVSKIVKAYIRSQAVIMSVVALICTVGLFLIGNRYYLIVGILVGFLDALPLFGVGAVMIPWSIVYIFMGNYINAAVLFVIFIICYFVREIMEPRLMGQTTGMSPVASLITMYAGYRIFGIAGMIAGPFIYVFVREVLNEYEKIC